MEPNQSTTGTETAGARQSLTELADTLRAELTAGRSRDLLVYFHVPFCSSKCIFCDWVAPVSVADLRSKAEVRAQYAQALCAQLRDAGPVLAGMGYKPRHIYWGGGTPTKFEVAQFEEVLTTARQCVDLTGIEEHTIEGSPETLSLAKLEGMRALGMNRLSIGAQSMDDEELRRIGRAHSSQQTAEAAVLARRAGFDNLNLDIIAGFPGQTAATVAGTLQQVIALEPNHVTVYMYRASPGTVMASQIGRGRRQSAQLTHMMQLYESSKRTLEDAGYTEDGLGYFAKGTQQRFLSEEYYFDLSGDYVGFGSGATSILAHHMLRNLGGRLMPFMSDPTRFGTCERFAPDRLDNVFPSLRMSLQAPRGIDLRRFRDMFGFEFAELRKNPLVASYLGYYRWCGAEFVETETHFAVSDTTRATAYIASLLPASRLVTERPLPRQTAAITPAH